MNKRTLTILIASLVVLGVGVPTAAFAEGQSQPATHTSAAKTTVVKTDEATSSHAPNNDLPIGTTCISGGLGEGYNPVGADANLPWCWDSSQQIQVGATTTIQWAWDDSMTKPDGFLETETSAIQLATVVG
jgi:hypothetical protein